MIEREGETWIAIRDAAKEVGVQPQAILLHFRKAGLTTRSFHEPRRGKPTFFLRNAEYQAWAKSPAGLEMKARAYRPPPPSVPPHLVNVLVPLNRAGLLTGKNRMEMWRRVKAGDLPTGTIGGFGMLVRIGDLGRLGLLDAALLAEFDAVMRGLMARDETVDAA